MLRKELAYYFSSPVAYIILGLYLLTISLFLWVIPGEWNIVDSGYADVNGLFSLSPWLLLMLCPALTMRLFSEEKLSGTWDLLRCQGISMVRIVMGKYMAAWLLTLMAILPCGIHFAVVYFLAEPMGNVDAGQFWGSMLGLCLISGTFTSIGVLAGCWSKSQIVSFLLGAVGCFVFYWALGQSLYESLGRGVIVLRDVVELLSVTAIAIAMAMVVLNHRR